MATHIHIKPSCSESTCLSLCSALIFAVLGHNFCIPETFSAILMSMLCSGTLITMMLLLGHHSLWLQWVLGPLPMGLG